MAITFRIEVCTTRKKADGTYNVKIRVTHNRKMRRIATPIYVKKEDLTRSLKLKNQSIIDALNRIIDDYRAKCNRISLSLGTMSVDDIVKYITDPIDYNKGIDFIQFANEHINGILSEGRKSTYLSYRTKINLLVKFIGRDSLDISEISFRFLNDYIEFLKTHKAEIDKKRSIDNDHSSTACIIRSNISALKYLYNQAKMKYNDDELGNIRIPWSPFTKIKTPTKEITRKRALPPYIIKMIADLPYKTPRGKCGNTDDTSSYNLAKDCFILSFCLMGMNSADLYNCAEIKGNMLVYNRTKTKSRREDKAEIHVNITPFIQGIVDKYRDKTGEKVFNFSQRYFTSPSFNVQLNKGLKRVAEDLNKKLASEGIDYRVKNLQYYAARHSWATIARNDLGIDKYVVHEGLNHSDGKMKITDVYIKKDFKAICEANTRVVDYVFNNPDLRFKAE